ncbi:endonuclease domain-containing protein [Gordonia sp. CPCC 206044]|uniref:endonuclease domain-containing protein n=1 Tax=Gordonia sp. CPCC 206044 TaxID=3140793 RepID=UPI003AF3B2E9
MATLGTGNGASLADHAAAWWQGLTSTYPRQIAVITPTRGRHKRAPAGVLVKYRALDHCDVTEYDGLQVTAPALTVLDAALTLDAKIVDDALLRGIVTPPQLLEAYTRYAHRRGASGTRRLLDAITSGARSEAERLAVRVLQEGSITGWRANVAVGTHLADFVFEFARVIVEIDGFAFHRDAETFQRDRTKRNAWIADGWTVLNFTWHDLADRPTETCTHIRAVL